MHLPSMENLFNGKNSITFVAKNLVFRRKGPRGGLLDDSAGDASSLEVVDHHGAAQDVACGLRRRWDDG